MATTGIESNVCQAAADTDYLVRAGTMRAELSATEVRHSLPLAGGQEKQVFICLKALRQDETPNPVDRLQG